MTIIDPAATTAPARPLRRCRRPPRRRRLRRRPPGLQPRGRPAPRRRRLPGRRGRGGRGRALRARAAGLRVAPQATGHNAGPARRPERHGAGQDVRAWAASRSTPSAGSPASAPACCGRTSSTPPRRTAWSRCTAPRPNVGVAGYSLGGGMGWLARSHGLQANSVTAIELVTADGELVRTDARPRPRAVLGAARRRRELRHRHRARVPALPADARSTPASCCGTGPRPSAC